MLLQSMLVLVIPIVRFLCHFVIYYIILKILISNKNVIWNRFNFTKNTKKSLYKLKIIYGSQYGNTETLANFLADKIKYLSIFETLTVTCATEYDPEFLLEEKAYCVFMIPTVNGGKAPDNLNWFCEWIKTAPFDFRIDSGALKHLKYCVIGLGDTSYGLNYNKVGQELSLYLAKMGGTPIIPMFNADEKRGFNQELGGIWLNRFHNHFSNNTAMAQKTDMIQGVSDDKGDSRWHIISTRLKGDDITHETNDQHKPKKIIAVKKIPNLQANSNSFVTDLEDLGNVFNKVSNPLDLKQNEPHTISPQITLNSNKKKSYKKGNKFISNAKSFGIINGNESAANNILDERPDMLSREVRSNLTKQGYKVIGGHSGVKLCRWTRSMLRGRGGCYKLAFYGINSSLCCEATPSLACANKCVFCWRHHTNPVGTEWRWKMDPPQYIYEQIIAQHKGMIKQLKGVPGVTPDRFDAAMEPKHCALSLVGEPIMYPRINQLVQLLHQGGVSTFLVTNAQFPEQIRSMGPVTQLYVSIDAHDKISLKAIDRPLNRDFWERFIGSLEAIAEKKGITRTIYRLTLVKKWNFCSQDSSTDPSLQCPGGEDLIKNNAEELKRDYLDRFGEDVRNYVDLIKLGIPDFIEIKGVTYCGDASNDPEIISSKSNEKKKKNHLTMTDIPWHTDVLAFGLTLISALKHPYHKITANGSIPNYEVACEHEHSNCILIADTKFKIQGVWHTWIDYGCFNQQAMAYYGAYHHKTLVSNELAVSRNSESNGNIASSDSPTLISQHDRELIRQHINSLRYSAPTPDWAIFGSDEKGFDPKQKRLTGKNRDLVRFQKS